MRRIRSLLPLLALGLAAAWPAGSARAQESDDDVGVKVSLTGFISSDIRYAWPQMNPFWCASKAGWRKGWCHGATDVRAIKAGFSRNENIARTRLVVKSGDYKGVAELDFVYTGISRVYTDLRGMSRREDLDPFRVEAHALYFDVSDFLVKGLDIRIGKQIVNWGRADMFNPTSNLNPLDLEDSLLFGDRIANNMIRVDYNPWKDLIISLVWVPIFRPNQVPGSAEIALMGVDRMPVTDPALRRRLHIERDFGAFAGQETKVTEAVPIAPDNVIESSQLGLRAAIKAAKMDFSLSYYYGRSPMPVPFVERTFGGDGFIDARTSLMFPRMHVLGFDWGGQIPLGKLGGGNRGIGFWFEMAVYFPQKVEMPIYLNNVPYMGTGEYDYDLDGTPGGPRPVTLAGTPFAKWVLGFDYTFNKHVFMNVQWVHGFVDEFGSGDFLKKGFTPTRGFLDLDTNNDGRDDLDMFADCGLPFEGNGGLCAKEYLRPRIGDYLVAGVDFKFYKEQMLLRLFFILDLTGVYVEEFVATGSDPTQGRRVRSHHNAFTPTGFSMTIFPQWTWSIGQGAEIALGGFWMIGKTHTKFGDPATGGSTIFMKGKFSF